MRFEPVEKRARCFRRHPFHLNRRPHPWPRRPDWTVQGLDARTRVGAHQRSEPALVSLVQPPPQLNLLQSCLFCRRQCCKGCCGVGKGRLAVQRQALAQPHEFAIRAFVVRMSLVVVGCLHPVPAWGIARHRRLVGEKHRDVDRQGLVLNVRVPRAAPGHSDGSRTAFPPKVGYDQHRRRLVRQALQLAGEGSVDRSGRTALKGN